MHSRAGNTSALMDMFIEQIEEATGLGAVMDLLQDLLGGATDPAFLSVVAVAGLVLGLVLGPHRLGMAVMLISSALCWSCLLFWPTNYQQFGVLLPCCGFFWGWACKNRLLGPIHTDGGVFSFLPGVVAGTLATLSGAPMHPTPLRGGFYLAATLLPALNFLVPLRHLATSRPPRLAQISERHAKPPPFGAVFACYCCSQLAFFPLAALHFGRACRLGWPAVLVALGLSAAMGAAAYGLAGLANAPILARQRREQSAAKKQVGKSAV